MTSPWRLSSTNFPPHRHRLARWPPDTSRCPPRRSQKSSTARLYQARTSPSYPPPYEPNDLERRPRRRPEPIPAFDSDPPLPPAHAVAARRGALVSLLTETIHRVSVLARVQHAARALDRERDGHGTRPCGGGGPVVLRCWCVLFWKQVCCAYLIDGVQGLRLLFPIYLPWLSTSIRSDALL